MSYKVKIPKCKFRLFLFILYNFFFVLYMAKKISNIYYLITISLFCISNFIVLLAKKRKISFGIKETKLGMFYIISLLVISLLIQLNNNDFKFNILFNDIIRMTLPIINGFIFVNTIDEKDFNTFFNIFLIRFILQFIFLNLNFITLRNILSISWVNSTSSMESSLAHDFIIMEMYYLYNNNRIKSIICMIFCMLSMKRLSFILAPILYLFSKKISNYKLKEFQIRILKICAIASPFIVLGLYSNYMQNFLHSHFGLDLNTIMSGRIQIYKTLSKNIPYYNGLGSSNAFLSSFVKSKYGTTWDGILHNDFLRLLLETTIVGVIIVANNLVEICKKNTWIFLMGCYLIIVAITSHIFNYFSVWITFYMIVMIPEKYKLKNEVTK